MSSLIDNLAREAFHPKSFEKRRKRAGAALKREAVIQTVSLSLFRFRSALDRAWAFSQMALARGPLRRVPGIGFHKLCGTGTGEGFTPVPNTAVYGILAVWPSPEQAREQIESAAVFRRYRDRAAESWTLFLGPTSARGRWAGVEPFEARRPAGDGPIAALTRAQLKPGVLPKFWGRVPDISAAIGEDPNVAFKIGMGEVPWINQITFSIWPDAATMAAFARADGPHARAIKAVRDGAWFSEELYARFEILGESGSWTGERWEGGRPLARLRSGDHVGEMAA